MSSSGNTSQSADSATLPSVDTSQTPVMSLLASKAPEHQAVSPSPLHQNDSMPLETAATSVEGNAAATQPDEPVRRYDIEKLIGIATSIKRVSKNLPVTSATALQEVACCALDWVSVNVQKGTSSAAADEQNVRAITDRVQRAVVDATNTLPPGRQATVQWLCSRPASHDEFGRELIIIQATDT